MHLAVGDYRTDKTEWDRWRGGWSSAVENIGGKLRARRDCRGGTYAGVNARKTHKVLVGKVVVQVGDGDSLTVVWTTAIGRRQHGTGILFLILKNRRL